MKRIRVRLWSLPSMQQTKALLIVGTTYLMGVILGCLCAMWAGEDSSAALREYMRGYLAVSSTRGFALRLWEQTWSIMCMPLLVFLLRFTVLGLLGIPFALGYKGFLMSFSVSAFVKSYGWSGAVAGGLLLGMTSIAELSCLLLLAVDSWEMAQDRGTVRRMERKRNGYRTALLCGMILCLVGMIQALFGGVMPDLLEWLLE